MKVEKHNAHGLQLVVTVNPTEALMLIQKLAQSILAANLSRVSRWFHFSSLFEDDNNKWEECSFDVVIETGSPEEAIEVK